MSASPFLFPAAHEALKSARLRVLAAGLTRAVAPCVLIVGLIAGCSAIGALSGLSNLSATFLAGGLLLAVAFLAFLRLGALKLTLERQIIAELAHSYGLVNTGGNEFLADRPMALSQKAGLLWDLQRQRTYAELAGAPRPKRPSKQSDAIALAAVAFGIVLFVGSLLLAPTRALRGLSLDFGALVGDSSLNIDAWATPPVGFGGPRQQLSNQDNTVTLIKGSTISVRVDGAVGPPTLLFQNQKQAFRQEREGVWSVKQEVNQNGALVVDRWGNRARWQIVMAGDAFPDAQIGQALEIDGQGRLRLVGKAADDHGISKLSVRLTPVDPPIGLAALGASDVPLAITDVGALTVSLNEPIDLRSHRFAGIAVKLQLRVTDNAGQSTISVPRELMLPERTFTSLPARAVAEQRRALVQEARNYKTPGFLDVVRQIWTSDDRFQSENRSGFAPEGIQRSIQLARAFLFAEPDTERSIALGLHVALARLEAARSNNEAQTVASLFYDIALALDRGDKTMAEQELAAARDALEQALRAGVGERELKEAMARLRAALDARLTELAQSGENGDQPPEGAEALSQSDLEGLIEALEESAQAGAQGEALALLDRLDQLMQNLTAGPGDGGGSQAGTHGGKEQGRDRRLDQLADQQQQLSDETLRSQTDSADNTGSERSAELGVEGLAQRQKALREQLGGNAASEAEKEAANAMTNAEQSLQQGDYQGALDAQDRAIGALRAAAELQDGQRNGDPLGRELGRNGEDSGRGTHVPLSPERRRAQKVLEEVRRRASDLQRPAPERGYLERLLDRFTAAPE